MYDSCLAINSPSISDFVAIVMAIIIIDMLVAIIASAGSATNWFQSLNKGQIGIWVIWTIWIIVTLLSYLALYFFYSHTLSPCVHSFWPDRASRDYVVALLFLINAFLSLGWVSIFFYIQNIGFSLWLVSILFVFSFWVFIYMWYIKPVSAIFLIPLLAFYVYLFYATAHLATLNNVPL